MKARARDLFTTVTTEGAVLPADLLARIAEGDAGLDGLTADSYHLSGERIGEATSRAWTRLLSAWSAFQTSLAKSPGEALVTGVTRERWLLPLFQELGYGRLSPSRGIEHEGKSHPVSHLWGQVPIHLVGSRIELDRRTAGAAGAAKMSPHGLVQDVLNKMPKFLWGFVSNGLRLRVLRDNLSLTRQAYVEFDLEAMMTGEVYSDFVLLWLLCHESRVEGDDPAQCWLERWSRAAAEQGTRALDQLRASVESAIEALGQGFLTHRRNVALLARLRSGALTPQDYYRQLLRLVYRLLFLFAAEDRGLLLDPTAAPEARELYAEWYSTARLRRLAERRRGTAHGDLFHAIRLVMSHLDEGCPALALPALGSFLWSETAVPDLARCDIANRDVLEAVRVLSFTRDVGIRRAIDYRNLGAEELGSVYESLLELHPRLNAEAGSFELATSGGHERKTSASYYTHTTLVDCVLASALDPAIDEAAAKSDPVLALLDLKVCDPACGSGHFLIAAGRRIAKRLAAVRSGDAEPSPSETLRAFRDVAGRCLYGVDINPMAVELCKVSLWMEALEPGRPLSFLDNHVQCGNALLGATPALMARGISDDAFDAIEGDDPQVATRLRRRNKDERSGQGTLFTQFVSEPSAALRTVSAGAAAVERESDATISAVRRKAADWSRLTESPTFRDAWFHADAWCAALVWPKEAGDLENAAVTDRLWRRLGTNAADAPQLTRRTVATLAATHRFFHWHLAFPAVFGDAKPATSADDVCGWTSGFDVVIGNPPWDTLSPDTKEFFSQYDAAVRSQDRAGQDAIVERCLSDAAIRVKWESHRRELYGAVHFMKSSGRYVLFAPGSLGKGDFNVYRMFVELALQLVREAGRASQIVPEGLYNGANCMAIRRELFSRCTLDLLLGFENFRHVWFPGVHGAAKFAIYSAQHSGATVSFRAAFCIRSAAELAAALAGKTLQLPVTIVEEFSPDALAVMEFGSQRDIDIASKMYARHPKFGDEAAGPPHREYMREIDMGTDRDLFSEDPAGLPLYEGRMVSQFDHRAKGYRAGRGRRADWEDLAFSDPRKAIQPQWYVVQDRTPDKAIDRASRYRIGYCDVGSPTNERTVIAALLPPRSLAGHPVPTIVFIDGPPWTYCVWLAIANSFALDFLARFKVALHVSFTVLDSLPFPRPVERDAYVRPLVERVLRLTCTGPEMVEFWNARAREGWVRPHSDATTVPGSLDDAERDALRAEVDAIVAREVYGLTRDELAYILDTFPIIAKRDTKEFGELRTKRLILEAYDSFARAVAPAATQPVAPVATPAPLRRVQPSREDRYRTCVPLLSLRAAAGGFSDEQTPEFEDWVEIPGTRRLEQGKFVAQVVGRSMEPLIPDGSYCLFKHPVTGTRQGRVVLVQHHAIHDADTGGSYTVKRYLSEKTAGPDGDWQHAKVRLMPENPQFAPIVLTPDDEGSVRIVAELVEVLAATAVEAEQPVEVAAASSVRPHPARQGAPSPRELVPAAAIDFAQIPNGAWLRPATDAPGETGAAITAVLKAVSTAVSARQVRLAALLALQPRLLTGLLAADDSANWRRLVGAEAAPLTPGVLPFVPPANVAWGDVVRHLRATGLLLEDAKAGTWARGPGIDAIETAGWPDGRISFVHRVLTQVGVDDVVRRLPQSVREWVDGEAA